MDKRKPEYLAEWFTNGQSKIQRKSSGAMGEQEIVNFVWGMLVGHPESYC